MFPSAAEEVAVRETLSLRCFQSVRCREMHPSLRLNLVSVEYTTLSGFNASRHGANSQIFSGVKLEGVQDGLI